MRSFLVAAVGLAIVGLSTSTGAVTISNASDSFENVGTFGVPNTQTFGEVFAAPVTGKLTSFTLYLNGGVGSLEGAVGTWCCKNSLMAGSPATLFKSGPKSSTKAQAFTFTPDVSVTKSDEYVAFLSVYGDPEAYGGTTMPVTFSTTPGLVNFVYQNAGFHNGPYDNPAWDVYGGNVEFTATFDAATEPATWGLMLMGIGGVGAIIRSRRVKTFATGKC